MGTDIISIACHHRLPVDKPMELIKTISKIYSASIQVIYYNPLFTKEPYYTILLELKCEDPEECLTIDLPDCDYLTKRTLENPVKIDWNSPILSKQIMSEISSSRGYEITGFKDSPNLEIAIYQELIELDPIPPFRWYSFISLFTEQLDPIDLADLMEYRKLLALHTYKLGCSNVIYFPDQGLGGFIIDKTRDTYTNFMNYINRRTFYEDYNNTLKELAKSKNVNQEMFYEKIDKESSITLDIPLFFKKGAAPICPYSHLDILTDDFSDLEE